MTRRPSAAVTHAFTEPKAKIRPPSVRPLAKIVALCASAAVLAERASCSGAGSGQSPNGGIFARWQASS
jgi:hypothetical protein